MSMNLIPIASFKSPFQSKFGVPKQSNLVGMDQWNIRNMLRITGGDPEGKIHRLLDFTPHPRDIDDPWYTRDFDSTYRDVSLALPALIEHLKV